MKKNNYLFLLVFVFCVGLAGKVYGEEPLSIEDRAKIGEIYSLEQMKRYQEAKPKIEDLHQRYPDNREVKWTYVRILGFGGDWKEAMAVFDELCSPKCDPEMLITYGHILEAQGPNPETLEQMKSLVDRFPDQSKLQVIYNKMQSWSNNPPQTESAESLPSDKDNLPAKNMGKTAHQHVFKEIVGKSDELLKTNPDDEAALLHKAQALSWQGDLRSSIKLYKKLIKDHPDEVLYYREGARVMGWAGKFFEASSLYDRACQRFPDDLALKAEASAKKAYYNDLFFLAETEYSNWLAIEPGNPEALFDLGQIHARAKRYAAAQKDYEDLLTAIPDNNQAQMVRDKADIYAHGWLTETGYQRREIDSQSRQADVRLNDISTQIRKSFLGNMLIGVKFDEMEYAFMDPFPNVHRQRYLASVEKNFSPDTFWKAGYGLSQSTEDIKDLQYRDAEVQFPFFTERFLWDVSYKRDDMIQNASTMLNHLQDDEYRLRTTIKPVKFLEIGSDGTQAHLTDGNDFESWGGDAAVHLSYDPKRLTLKYRWQDLRYDESNPAYFSPGNFISKRVSVEWQQSLNKRNAYWGADQFWYLLRYELIMDPGDVRGHMGTVGINWDINKRLTLRAEGQRIFYENSNIYDDTLGTTSLLFNF